MKKTLTMFLAAAAVLAGCSKIEEQKVDPNTASENSFFYGSIEQPSDPTRTTLDESNGVQWEKGDTITAYRLGASVFADTTVKMVFYAENEGSASFFSAKDISAATEFHKALDGTGYDVYFGTKDTIPCIPSSIKKYESGSVRHLPMHAKVAAGVYGPGQRKAVFNNVCAVLKVTFPAGSIVTSNKLVVSAEGEDKIAGNYYMGESGLTLISDGSSQTITYSFTAASEERVFYIPVAPGEHQLTFSAKEGNSDKRTIRMTKAVKLEANYIYPINFTEFNYEIKAETTEINLPSNSGKVNITVKENNSQNLVIKYSDPASANHPTIVNIDADGFTVSNLTINLPSSHVELSNGTGVNIVSQTSQNTLVVNDGFNVTGDITIKKGNLEVHGSVSKVTIDEDVAQIVKITADDNKVTTIENKSSVKADISAEGANVTGNGGGNFSCGGNSYLYLADAFEAASGEATVTVGSSCTVDKPASVESGKTITLDLNGKSLNSGGKNARISVDGGSLIIQSVADGGQIFQEDTVDAHTIMVNAGSLTVKSGSISSSKSAAIYVPGGLNNSANPIAITLEGGTIIGESSSTGAVGIKDTTYVNLTVSGSTIKSTKSRGIYWGNNTSGTINGGEISSKEYAVYYLGTNSLAISGGKIKSEKYALYVAQPSTGEIRITGGLLRSTGSHVLYARTSTADKGADLYISENACLYADDSEKNMVYQESSGAEKRVKFYISGGYYSSDGGLTVAGRLVDEYTIQSTSESEKTKYELEFPKKVALAVSDMMIGDNNYSLEDGLKFINEDTKSESYDVKILNDITLISNFEINRSDKKQITIDLNGKTITCKGTSKRINVIGSSVVTINGVNGTITSDNQHTVKVAGTSNLTIGENITVTNTSTSSTNEFAAVWVSANGNLTFNGTASNTSSTRGALDVTDGNATLNIGATAKLTSPVYPVYNGGTKGATINFADGVLTNVAVYPGFFTNCGNVANTDESTKSDYPNKISVLAAGDLEATFTIGESTKSYLLTDAITLANSAADESTIQLQKNVTLSSLTKFKNTNAKKITLDLNGKTITESKDNYIEVGSEFTLSDTDANNSGKISQAGDYCALRVNDGAKFEMNSGKLTCSGSHYFGTLYIYQGNVTLTGTACVENKGTGPEDKDKMTYTAPAKAIFLSDKSQTSPTSKLTISENARVHSDNYAAIYARFADALTISGGTVSSKNSRPVYKNSVTNSSITGGTYNKVFTDTYLSDSYFFKANVDGANPTTYTVTNEGSYQASLNDIRYSNLSDAVTAANSATGTHTITMLSDVTLSSMVEFSKAGNTYKLDLNNKTITESADKYIKISAKNKVDISNGTITQPNDAYSIYAHSTGTDKELTSELNIKDVTIQNSNGSPTKTTLYNFNCKTTLKGNTTISGYRAVGTYGSQGSININDANVTLSGTNRAIYCSYGKVNISMGTFVSTGADTYVIGNNNAVESNIVTITGGKFKGTKGATYGYYKGRYVIQGGIFSHAPNNSAIAEGYECVDNDDTTTKGTYPKKVQQKSN